MDAIEMKNKLLELKEKDLPHPKIDDLLLLFNNPKMVITEEEKEKITIYLDDFMSPDGNCPLCGLETGGVFGTFRWGLATGEGSCNECKYPMRAQNQSV